jgi:hypothetical protein
MSLQTRTLSKILDFSALPIGWHYGNGTPINKKVIDSAIDIYNAFLLVGLSRNDAFPGVGSEVLVTAYYRKPSGTNHYIAVIVEQNGSFSFRHEIDGQETAYVQSDNVRAIKLEIYNVAGQIWNISGSSIQKTLISTVDALATWRLSVPQMEGCPSSIEFVPRELAAA